MPGPDQVVDEGGHVVFGAGGRAPELARSYAGHDVGGELIGPGAVASSRSSSGMPAAVRADQLVAVVQTLQVRGRLAAAEPAARPSS